MTQQQQETAFDEKELITFKDGLFGFEEYKTFLPIATEEDSDSVIYLQSTEEEHLSFLLMNPFRLTEQYSPVLSAEDKRALGTENEEDLSYYVLCVIKEPLEDSTINLKCPIVVNALTRQARQVILESDEYGMRHRLETFSDKEGA